MKLPKTTMGLLISAILLSIGVSWYEFQGKERQEEVKKNEQKIFEFEEEDIQKLTLIQNKDILQFERTNNPERPWKMTQPQSTTANDAVVAFLLNLLVEGTSDRRFTVPASQLKEYGLEKPFATIIVDLKNLKTHQLQLGLPNYQDQLIYAKVADRKQPEAEILLVSKDFQFALDRELKEWQDHTDTGERQNEK